MTPEVLVRAQQLLDEGLETAEVADRLGIKRDTFDKAVKAGRLHKPIKKKTPLVRWAPRARAAPRTVPRCWAWGHAM